MRQHTDRRSVLKGALGLVSVAAPSFALAGCSGGAGDVAATSLTDRVSLLAGAGPNVLALATSDGVVLVDAGAAEHARSVIAAARRLPGGGRVRTVFNTHYHPDQTGANDALAKDGAEIIAHERVRFRLSTDLWIPAELRYEPARPAEAWPTQTFLSGAETTVGDETIQYGYLPQPHTDGDAYVFFKTSNVLAAGDAAAPERDPIHDWFAGGWLGGRLDAQAQLLALADDETRIVPSYGPVMTKAELQAELDVMTAIHERSVEMLRRGFSAEDMLAEGVLGTDRTFQDPDKLVYDIWKGLWGHQSSLSHDIV